MSRTRYREYFVGGPWNGQDRLDMLDTAQITYTGVILYRVPTGDSPVIEYSDDVEGEYYLRRFHLFGTLLSAWVDHKETEVSAGKKLAEILLAPHKRTDE